MLDDSTVPGNTWPRPGKILTGNPGQTNMYASTKGIPADVAHSPPKPASWMAEWRSLNRIIEEAGTVRPDIKTWAPSALQTFGDDIVPSEKVRQIAEDAIRLLKPGS